MNQHAKGLLITTLGVLFVVPDSLFVRLIAADPLVTAFWRGLTSGLLILVVSLFWHGKEGYRSVTKTGWSGLLYILLIGSTAPAFVFAITNTSVANVVFIFASIPVFASLFSRIFLGEAIQNRMVVTMIFVILGLAVIAFGSGTNEIASWKGDVWALYVSMAYAAALTAVRNVRHISMIPAIPFAYVGAALVMFLLHGSPFHSFVDQWPLFVGHGIFVAVATCLLTLGPRYISSAEVSLLILLESVLAPLLVWVVIGEEPGNWALIGGAIVVGALLISNFVALRQHR